MFNITYVAIYNSYNLVMLFYLQLLPGLIVKLTAICTMLVSLNTLGKLIYSLDAFPDWAVEKSVVNGNVNITADTGH